MATVDVFAAALGERIHIEDSAPWDPTGLQIGDPEAEVEVIGVCHEVTEAIVARVEEQPVDLLVTYHPLLFDPVTRIVGGRSPGARAHRLIRAGVNLFVAHTDFDVAEGGAADALASALDLVEVEAFGPSPDGTLPRIGRVGTYHGTGADLVTLVTTRLGRTGLRTSLGEDHQVSRVAVVPGSGSDLIAAASDIADVLVTGDVSHHRAISALDNGLAVVDPGHIATERPGLKALLGMVGEAHHGPVVDLTSIDPATWL